MAWEPVAATAVAKVSAKALEVVLVLEKALDPKRISLYQRTMSKSAGSLRSPSATATRSRPARLELEAHHR